MKLSKPLAITIICLTSLIFFPVSASSGDRDGSEDDNTSEQAKVIVLNDVQPQDHTFHDAEDQDWVKFYGLSGQEYTITAAAGKLVSGCSIVLDLYDTDGTTLLKSVKTMFGEPARLDFWTCPADGIYYVNVRHESPESCDGNTEYDLTAFQDVGPVPVRFEGIVADAFSESPLEDVRIRTSYDVSALSLPDDGHYLMFHDTGDYNLTAAFAGYLTFLARVIVAATETRDAASAKLMIVTESGSADWDGIIRLIPVKCDISGDGSITLADTIPGLRILVGTEPSPVIRAVSGDENIGLKEIIFILQELSGQNG